MKQWGGFFVGDKVRYIGKGKDEYRPLVGTIGVVENGSMNDEDYIRIRWPVGALSINRDWSYVCLYELEHAGQSDNLIAPTFEELTGFAEDCV